MVGPAFLMWWVCGILGVTIVIVRFRKSYRPRNAAVDCFAGLVLAAILGPFTILSLWHAAKVGSMDGHR